MGNSKISSKDGFIQEVALGKNFAFALSGQDFDRRDEYLDLAPSQIDYFQKQLNAWNPVFFAGYHNLTKYLFMIARLKEHYRPTLRLFDNFTTAKQQSGNRLQLEEARWQPLEFSEVILVHLHEVIPVVESGIVVRPEWITSSEQGLRVMRIGAGNSANCVKGLLVWAVSGISFNQCLSVSRSNCIQIFIAQKPFVADCLRRIIANDLVGAQAAQLLKALTYRGPELGFKLDSIHAHQYFHEKREGSKRQFIYATKGYKIFAFKEQSWRVVSAIYKRRKVRLEQQSVAYFQPEQSFIFFNPEKEKELLKVESTCSMEQEIAEVQLFQKLPFGLKYPTVVPRDEVRSLLVFPGDNPISYVITMEHDSESDRLYYELKQGLFSSTRGIYFVTCSHKSRLFILFESPAVFEKGIDCAYWDVKMGMVPLRLRFACDRTSIYQEFLLLDVSVSKVDFAVQIQHNVLFVLAGRIPLILDFNFKVFFSFCSRRSLETFLLGKPSIGSYPFEIKNQTFKVDLRAQHHSCHYQNGLLKIIVRSRYELGHLEYSIDSLRQCFVLESHSLVSCKEVPKPVRMQGLPLIDQEHEQPEDKLYRVLREIECQDKMLVELVVRENKYMVRRETLLDEEVKAIFKYSQRSLSSRFLALYYQHVEADDFKRYVVYHQYYRQSLQAEIAELQAQGKRYKCSHMAYLANALCQMFLELNEKGEEHGHLVAEHLFFDGVGRIRGSSWYQPQRSNFIHDLVDVARTLFEAATAEFIKQEFTIDFIQKARHKTISYPGLDQFCSKLISQYNSLTGKQVRERAVELEEKLQKEGLHLAGNDENYLFNFKPGTDLFSRVSTRTQKLQQFRVEHDKYDQFRFSKYDSLVYYPQKNNLFLLEAKSRKSGLTNFAYLAFGIEHQSFEIEPLHLQKLQAFPAQIVKPTLFLDEKAHCVYSFGGYQSETKQFDFSRFSKRVFRYDIIKDSWAQLPALPYGLVGGTAVISGRSILIFGGVTSIYLKQGYFSYFQYDLNREKATYFVDPGVMCPIARDRLFSPMIKCLGQGSFLYYKIKNAEEKAILFTLRRGQNPVQFMLGEQRIFSKKEEKDWLLNGQLRFAVMDWKAFYLDGKDCLHVTHFNDLQKMYTEVLQLIGDD